MIAKAKVAINSINVEVKKPMNEPKAALRACLLSILEMMSSAKNAPRNGKINTPNGMGAIKPTTRPIPAPYIPYLLPPNFLIPNMGMR